ncbi:TlpA disulfide reductase family protein [Corynebacterium breve]|uniref:TlpA disulfide reductase family protein n=1 Tax=Corynebacterium breve TaxID=3049799 RepID=A0ABY8VKD4_9CORY|nr:TlpA disulfide reductase family protein [Corynebacterium breve]WIM68030.1 TlpA disulfide reductase family protein [Corynebacterium breve]
MRKRLTLAATMLVATVTLAACGQGDAQTETFAFHTPGGKVEIFYEEEDRAPLKNFSGESLMDEGKTISLDDYEGKIVVLNAWGQWCAPCRAEVDDLQEAHEALGDDGTVLGINVRDYNPQIARDFATDNGVTYPSVYDPPFKTAAALGGIPTSVIPTTIVLDSEHRPAAVFLREVSAQDILDVTNELK